MSLGLSDADANVLSAVAEFHVVTLGQLAIALDRNAHALRRRLNCMAGDGLIRVLARRPRAMQGRPAHMVTLCETGFDLLRVCGRVSRSAIWDRDAARRTQNSEHQLLINDLRVQLIQMERFLSAFQVRYFGRRNSCSDDDKETVPTIEEDVCLESGETIEFVPDGVFSVAHRELDKTLLFFLEADRATEPLTSARRGRGLAGKIAAYQAYLQVGQHARYEEILKTSLRGFRMLLLVEGSSRWVSACRLVRESPPSEFIWLTRRDLLLQVGCWGPIWAAGGRITEPHQSILGTKMPQPCPTPSEVGRKNARTK